MVMRDDWIEDIFKRRSPEQMDAWRADLRRVDDLRQIQDRQLQAQLSAIQQRLTDIERIVSTWRKPEGQ
jgi:hypothetical protein